MSTTRVSPWGIRKLTSLRALLAQAFVPAGRNLQYMHNRMRPLAIIAVIGFPLYFYVWHDLFPQPYENLPLRIVGSLLFMPMLFAEHWPASLKRFMPYYWYAAVFYSLPFFFTFMLLKNNGSDVWIQSALIAAFVLVLLLDWLMLLLNFVIGIGVACLAYWLTTHPAVYNSAYPTHLAIFSFAVAIGVLANYDMERIRIEQERAMLATAGSIAHELRTPLLAIRAGASGLSRYLPSLLETYSIAQQGELPVPKIRRAHLQSMDGVISRIEQEALHSNAIIDMLLANARFTGGFSHGTVHCSIGECVRAALERYPFRDGERDRVLTDLATDFTFHGADMLMTHVLFNLLKNALRGMASVDSALISIRLVTGPRSNQLLFRDTGVGIAPDVVPHIFTRFYTSPAGVDDASIGTGIGLAFCRDVMRDMGGAIDCQSVEGMFTEFTLTFPRAGTGT
ncbi:HAMP domain-containing sensor histidine kinase [Paraburkholderia sp. BL21I4N1]|uniref:sensor histidine kinase n=1 Tax=Paraburkholderia sp. BL21I4N1 TaxID=1938801 RepID=UPI000D467D41|nr:HAMP domain-containing sensor histidine kinase [Paraburkholderia sp. BL21I4N1]PQV44934.1 two-component system CAI-1 autoinducer sensor kinase/phosphatase CqsS [Paraburkholderia sp. BL21I4N1]